MAERHWVGPAAMTAAALATAAFAAAGRAQPQTETFPVGTFLTRITASDLITAGLPAEDAHWETLTFSRGGTWQDVWFHPRAADQQPAQGRYVVTGSRLRLLGTPDEVRWSYARGRLTFSIVHVPDRLARLVYTAHPWRRVR